MSTTPNAPIHRLQAPSAAVSGTLLLITAANCEAATGLRWRVLRKHAGALGIPTFSVGRKLCIPAQRILDALERSGRIAPAPLPLEEQSDDAIRESMRRELGIARGGR